MRETVPTPYCDMTTPEVTGARESLTRLLADLLPARERAACEWLHAYATEELARRLVGFVGHADGQVFGRALESLAFDVGIVRGPTPVLVRRAPSSGAPMRRTPQAPKSLLLQQPDGSLKAVAG